MSDTSAIAGFKVVSQDAWEAALAACVEYRAMVDKLEAENAALREALAIEKERSLYWRSIAGRKEAQP